MYCTHGNVHKTHTHHVLCTDPGWKADRLKELNVEKHPQLEIEEVLGKIQPRPLLNKDGLLVSSRSSVAASRLGRHFVVTFFDELDGVDLHNIVSDDI